MQFLYPSFLYALGLIAIPILIHLFNFRRYKKIVFSDIRFLKALSEQNKKQQTLKKYLILLSRILMIIFMVLAFAQPFIPFNKKSSNFNSKIVSIYIDNSFSMQSLGKNGPLLDQAKAKAKEIAQVYAESDNYQLLTNDFEGKHQRLVSQKDFLQMLEEVQISAAHRNISEIYERQKQLLNGNIQAQKNCYWISDFQKNMIDYQHVKLDSAINLRLVPLENTANQNVWIDSVWLKEPFLKMGSSGTLTVIVKNQSESGIENQPLVLKIDGVEKAIQNYSCRSNDKTIIDFNITLKDSLWHKCEFSLTDYPLTYDDKYYVTLRAQQTIKVLVLNQNAEENAFSQVYALDPLYQLSNQNLLQVNFANFQKNNLLILNEPEAISSGLIQELKNFMDNGGVVLLIPSSAPKDIGSINLFLDEIAKIQLTNFQKTPLKVASIEVKDILLDQVFAKIPDMANLPVSNENWQIQTNSKSIVKTVMQFNNDWPFLIHAPYKKGNLFVVAASIKKTNSNFAQHALFVPTFLRMPLLAKTAYPLAYNLGEQVQFYFDNPQGEKLFKLKNQNQEFLIEAYSNEGIWSANLNNQIKDAGTYDLMAQNNLLACIAFNYNRKESFPQTGDISELSTKLKATELESDLSYLKKKINLEENGTPYWRVALILALIFVLIEMLLLKLIK